MVTTFFVGLLYVGSHIERIAGLIATVTVGFFLLTRTNKSKSESTGKILITPVDNRLIDLQDFRIVADDSICQKTDSKKKLLQICIHSSRKNSHRRNAIRNTWGKIKEYKGWQISIAFLLGSPESDSVKKVQGYTLRATEQSVKDRVVEESKIYNDLVVGSFIDSYRNLTYKHMMGFKWLLDSCRQVDAYIKTDDDVFVNIYKTIDWLSANELEDHFYCYVLRGYSPWRSKRYKFYISKDEYRPDKFPDYCSGIGYITRPSLIRKLYNISLSLRYLWVEDLFSTGLLTKYFNEIEAQKSERNVWDSNDSTLNPPAQVHLEDMSKLYLNEQYSVYKKWIEDPSQTLNPWLFILLEKKYEQDVAIDQQNLWRKTLLSYTSDDVY